MKGHVLRLLIFSLVLIALDRTIHMLLLAAMRQTEVGKESGGMVNKVRSTRAEVVVLGSSRANRHYDPEVLGKTLHATVYNAGCDGQGLPYMRGLADLVMKTYTPSLLLLNVDPSSVATGQVFFDRMVTLAPFMDESPVIRELIYSRGFFEPVKYLSRSFRFNGKVLPIIRNQGSKETMNGYRPLYETLKPTEHDTAAPPEGSTRSQMLAANPRMVELLLQIIRSAEKAGTRVALATSPRWRADGKVDPAECNLLAFLNDLCLSEGVPYIVVTQENTPAFRSPILFADRDHLNAKGAKLFSQELADQLVRKGFAPDKTPKAVQ